VDTFVLTPPPARGLVSRIHLPYTEDRHQYWVLLRHGDTVEFGVTQARVEVVFDSGPEEPHVQVESSGPGANRKIKHEIKDEADTDDETDDEAVQPTMDLHRATSAEESQHLFSTSREHLSPTPRPVTRESQVVKETPNRRRIRSQHESIIPESLPMDDTYPEQPQPLHNITEPDTGPMSVLPDVHTGELPDTSPSETLRFHVPTQPTPSPFDHSFSAAEVGMLVSNLNEDNPASQVPPPSASPQKTAKSVVIPSQLHEDSSTEVPTEEAKSPDSAAAPPADTPAVAPDVAMLEDVASPVDIINDEITNVKHATDASDTDDTATIEPTSVPPKAPTVRVGRKRKTVSDSGSALKRAKIVEADASADEITPVSTASISSSGKGLETPSGSAPTRISLRRKSLDEVPPSTVSRRVSNRHKSIDSESAPSGSPSKTSRRYSGDDPVILFSNTKVIDKAQLMKFLKNQNASKTEDIKSANFLCVGPGELLKTPKLLHSLTLKKTVVTDDWVSKSTSAGFLLDPNEFLPEELTLTKHRDRTQIFADQIIYVTPAQRLAYKKGWDDVMAIIRQAGGTNPLTGPLSKHDTSTITLYIGADKDDNVAAELQEKGETVYKKDILGASIVHGELLMDESLELPPVEVNPKAKAEPKSAKKGGRKKKT
jgi:hypothetical protein